jgi:hypothetical protein
LGKDELQKKRKKEKRKKKGCAHVKCASQILG